MMFDVCVPAVKAHQKHKNMGEEKKSAASDSAWDHHPYGGQGGHRNQS